MSICHSSSLTHNMHRISFYRLPDLLLQVRFFFALQYWFGYRGSRLAAHQPDHSAIIAWFYAVYLHEDLQIPVHPHPLDGQNRSFIDIRFSLIEKTGKWTNYKQTLSITHRQHSEFHNIPKSIQASRSLSWENPWSLIRWKNPYHLLGEKPEQSEPYRWIEGDLPLSKKVFRSCPVRQLFYVNPIS